MTPEPRNLDMALLPTGRGEAFYLARFMEEFSESADGTAIIKAPSGHVLSVSARMFEDHKKGGSKIGKRGRAPFLLYLADAIKHPEEVRLIGPPEAPNELRLLAWYAVAGMGTVAIIAGFRPAKRVWEGWTGYQSPKMSYVQTKRDGRLVYTRSK